MASTATIGDLEAAIRHIGKGIVFYMVGAYAGTGTDLTLVWLGDTEGEITIEDNPTYNELITPEVTGDIARSKWLSGIKPVVTGRYDGKPVVIPMTGLTVAAPIGLPAKYKTPPHTAPEFGAFVLMKR